MEDVDDALFRKKTALRDDARRGPASRGEVSARAADGLRSHSKIAPQESAPARAGTVQVHGLDSEDAIWQSEVRLKGVAGGVLAQPDTPPDMSI